MKESGIHQLNHPFYAMDIKSYLSHPDAPKNKSAFLCADIEGVFAPNYLIEKTMQKQVKECIDRDELLLPVLKEIVEVPEIIENLYKKAKREDEQLCLTQIALYPSMAQKLMYSMINEHSKSGNITKDSIADAIECRDAYIQSPLTYDKEYACKITLRRPEENFAPLLLVHHYFCAEVSKLVSRMCKSL